MSIFESVKSGLVPVHKEGWRFIAIFAGVTLLLQWLELWPLALLGLVATAWCAYFFRDPTRVTPQGAMLVIAPADGRISAIEKVIPPAELALPAESHIRISTFMNVFDVHINRSPLAGRLIRLNYVPGLFLNADLDKASSDNERQALTLQTAGGTLIGVVQIAGLIARRIVKFVGEGDSLNAGQRFGLIRFGSRVDVYLPQLTAVKVCVGQRCVAGETVLADLSVEGPAQQGKAG